MSKRILSFPYDSSDIPRPVSAGPGDSFAHLDIVDELYAHVGFFPGAALVAQAGLVSEGALHYAERGGHGFLAQVGKATAYAIHLTPLDGTTPASMYARDGLDFIGQIVEIYPRGLNGSRWVLFPVAPADATRPLLEAVAN